FPPAGAPGRIVAAGDRGRGTGGAHGASIVIDRNDVLHAVWQSSEPRALWYSRSSVRGSDAADRVRIAASWTRADGTPGAERIDAPGSQTELGDVALDEADRLWVAYSRSSGVQEGQTYRFQDEGQEYNY